MYTKDEILEKLQVFNDDKFIFEPEKHVYTYEGQIMSGCTTFLNRFIKQFDVEYWAQKKADDNGITKEEQIKEWDVIRDRSCDLGTLVHDYIENFYEKNSTELTDDEEANERIKFWHEIYDERLHVLESIGSEIRIFSKKYNMAGTIDKLYLHDGMLVMGDWKTNKKIKTDKDFNFHAKLLFPFENLKDNEINKYSLQLSMYALMLEEAGLIVDSFFICHIPHDGACKVYKTKDLRAELRNYLNNSMLLTESIDEETIKKETKLEIIW